MKKRYQKNIVVSGARFSERANGSRGSGAVTGVIRAQSDTQLRAARRMSGGVGKNDRRLS